MTKVEITHPDKILFPKGKITKQELADYYSKVAILMLPHIRNRPISMQRFPQGIDKQGFFQKNAPQGMPPWVKTKKIPLKEKAPIQMILCNDKATLLWLANQNCITPHIWLSKIDKPDYPDKMVFDLDPGPSQTFKSVITVSLLLKELLETKYRFKPSVMTTGSRGLHVTVSLQRKRTFEEVRTLAKAIADTLAQAYPKKCTTEARIEKRKGLLYIDTMRNAHGQTVIAPYSVRALTRAPIAMPLEWKDLKKPGLKANSFTIRNIDKWL